MTYDCCTATTRHFDEAFVEDEIRRSGREGSHHATRSLLDALLKHDMAGLELLEIGGGSGSITFGLMAAGIERATFVEIAPPYLAAAEAEARRLKISDRMTFLRADFVEIQDDIGAADVVVLDRAVCCYPDARALIEASVAKCRRVYGLSYPRDTLLSRIDTAIKNRRRRRRKNPFRTFVHSEGLMRGILLESGFEPSLAKLSPIWRSVVYVRTC